MTLDFDIRLDPWPIEYGAEIAAGQEDDDANVKLDVEQPEAAWAPIAPPPIQAQGELWFVDGVRRLEARIVVRQGEQTAPGAFGSFAVGSVCAQGTRIAFGPLQTARLVTTGGGLCLPAAVKIAPALVYQPTSTSADDEPTVSRAIHEAMRAAEERLGRALAKNASGLVLLDGPLTFADPERSATIGYIKRIERLYVGASGRRVLVDLPASHRTPVFVLRSSRRFARFSWFLRLATPRPGDAELTGLVRLEIAETVGIDAARRLADACAALLPRYASLRGLHARAPQNLLPIGALEERLRRELGDQNLVRKQIEHWIGQARRTLTPR